MAPISLLSLLLFLLFKTLYSADIFPGPGSTLRANNNTSSWQSPGGNFSFAFVADPDNPGSYVAGVTFSGLPIWKAGVPPASVDAGGSFDFLSDGNLRLLNGSGAVIWQSGTAGLGVTAAALNDQGNFALRNRTGIVVWDTFSNPTDTILQNQNFTSGMTLKSGVYSFSVRTSGNLTLVWNNSITYLNQGFNSTLDRNKSLTAPFLTLQSVGILRLFDATLSSPVVVAYSSDYGEGGDIVRFLRLDSDGNLRAYSATRGSSTLDSRWSAVQDQCMVFGWCGNMGVCSYNDSGPICICPSGNFEFVDPNNPRLGCKRKQRIEDCPGSSTMFQMEHTQFLTYDPERSSDVFFVGITACRLNCLAGGSCVASTSLSDGTGLCFLKVSSFVSGYQSPALPSTSFVKVCAPGVSNQPPPASSQQQIRSSKLRVGVIVLVVVGTVLGLMFMEFGLWWSCCRNSRKFGTLSAQYALLEYASGAPVQFSYKDLQRSTKDFGLAKLVNPKDHRYRTLTSVRGTRGYLAPEWLANLPITSKSDVYSYGMVLLEIVSGRRNFDVSEDTGRKKFSLWAYEEFDRGNVSSIVDRRLSLHDIDAEQLFRAIQVSFWCIQEQPAQRPSMGKVVQMLEGILVIEKPPAPKATEGSLGSTSTNASASVSALSTFATSAPAPSSGSSHQALGLSSISGRNTEKTFSSI
ncbi:hypothetical protein MRB53_034687 [Persea americana]|uniref:Uncharacterized protein n=1 Tax=Persea americana TaxID=3435 RepID=A0ACC2K2L1_PERAE|nr:hypothetical protein MRB53_034687 [Persea americana]